MDISTAQSAVRDRDVLERITWKKKPRPKEELEDFEAIIIIRNGELAECCSARLICTCIYLYQRTVRMRSAGPT